MKLKYLVYGAVLLFIILLVTADSEWRDIGNGKYEKWTLDKTIDTAKIQQELDNSNEMLSNLKTQIGKEGYIQSCKDDYEKVCEGDYQMQLIMLQDSINTMQSELDEIKK